MSKKDEIVLEDICQALEGIEEWLEQIAKSLEKIANPPIQYIPVTPSPQPLTPRPYGGYRCSGCGTWVGPGQIHSCTGRTWPTTSPNICRSDPDLCSSTWKGGPVTTWNFPIAGTSVGETITGITELS